MNPRPLRVLVVDDERSIATVIRRVLERRGHEVTVATRFEDAVRLPAPEVLVTDLFLAGASGIELLERFHARGEHPRAVFVTGAPTVESCRRALLMGATEFLTKPFRMEELVQAVEQGAAAPPECAPPAPTAPSAARVERDYPTGPGVAERAARDVAADLLRQGVGPTVRARVATALAEVVDNARRHAYEGEGRVSVVWEREERHLTLTVADGGRGFDAAAVAADCLQSTALHGLARVSALCEGLELDSAPDRGARVVLRFAIHLQRAPVAGGLDLSDQDLLTPAQARRVLAAVDAGDAELQLSPAMAVVVGRLLNGPDPRRAVEGALWS